MGENKKCPKCGIVARKRLREFVGALPTGGKIPKLTLQDWCPNCKKYIDKIKKELRKGSNTSTTIWGLG